MSPDDENAALAGSISRNVEELLNQDSNSNKLESQQYVSLNQMESNPVQILPTNDSSPDPPNQWLLKKRIEEATQESASIRDEIRAKGMDKTEEKVGKEYNTDDYSSHDNSDKANISKTTWEISPSKNQKENKGLSWSNVVKGGKSFLAKVTRRQASEDVDYQPANEGEKKLRSKTSKPCARQKLMISLW